MDKGLLVCAQPVQPIKCRKTDIGNSLRGHDLRLVWCVKDLKDFRLAGASADDGFVAFPLT